jgi:hypothetical protein
MPDCQDGTIQLFRNSDLELRFPIVKLRKRGTHYIHSRFEHNCSFIRCGWTSDKLKKLTPEIVSAIYFSSWHSLSIESMKPMSMARPDLKM